MKHFKNIYFSYKKVEYLHFRLKVKHYKSKNLQISRFRCGFTEKTDYSFRYFNVFYFNRQHECLKFSDQFVFSVMF